MIPFWSSSLRKTRFITIGNGLLPRMDVISFLGLVQPLSGFNSIGSMSPRKVQFLIQQGRELVYYSFENIDREDFLRAQSQRIGT